VRVDFYLNDLGIDVFRVSIPITAAPTSTLTFPRASNLAILKHNEFLAFTLALETSIEKPLHWFDLYVQQDQQV